MQIRTMIDHLKQLSLDADEVILATLALARRAQGQPPISSPRAATGASPAKTRVEMTAEYAKNMEELKELRAKKAEWEKKVREPNSVTGLQGQGQGQGKGQCPGCRPCALSAPSSVAPC